METRSPASALRTALVLLGGGCLVAALVVPLPGPLLDGLLLGSMGLAGALLLTVLLLTGPPPRGGGGWLAAQHRRLYRLAARFGGSAALSGEAELELGPVLRVPRFPALLTLAVLLRLALTVAALRLLLSSGEAGWVIGGVTALAGQDARVALALLLLCGAAQHLVLARGGERAAEVAARFALDALPGRQAAIEADLRAGALTPAQARRQRGLLVTEAQRYGALDGVLRLLRGDVIGGLLALALVLLFGTWLGATRDGLALLEALERAAAQAAGLGLTTQVPVVLAAAAALLLLAGGAGAGRPTTKARGAVLEITVSAELMPAARRALAQARGALGFPPAARVVTTAAPARLQVRLRGAPLLDAAGDAAAQGAAALPQLLQREAATLLGVDEVQALLDDLQRERPVLVRETVPRLLSLAQLTALARALLEDGLTPLPLAAVLEALAAHDSLPRPPGEPLAVAALAEQVRDGLGAALLPALGATSGELSVVTLDAEMEELLRESLRGEGGQEVLALEPELAGELQAAAAAGRRAAPGAVVLCPRAARRALQRLLALGDDDGAAIAVVAPEELPARWPLRVVGRITPAGFRPAHLTTAGLRPSRPLEEG